MEDVEASWSSCLPRQGRRYLLFVQICEPPPPRPSPAHIKGVMNPSSVHSFVQLSWGSLLPKHAAPPSELSPCGGSPDNIGGGEGALACLPATATLQRPSFLWL